MDILSWGQGLVEALGYLGVFVVILLFSLSLTIPMPASALVIFAGALLNPFLVGLLAASASVIGESVAFGLGYKGRRKLKGKKAWLVKVQRKLKKYPYFLPFFAMMPIPSMVLGFSSGMLKFKPTVFVLAVFFGKLVKMLFYAYLGYFGLELLTLVS